MNLLEDLKSGSEQAFTQLYNQYNPGLCSYAYRILGDNDQAKEVVHLTFCHIWDIRKKLEVTESIKSYLYKSVYNNCITRLRKNRQYKKYVELGFGDLFFIRIVQNPFTELKLIDSESRKIILDAIKELPQRRRDIFVKCKIKGMTYPQVAEELNISVKTVETQMTTALKTLRKKLDWLLILMLVG